MKKMGLLFLLSIFFGFGCGSSTGDSDDIATSQTQEADIPQTLSASGIWKVLSNNCTNPDNSTRIITVTGTSGGIEDFVDSLGATGQLNTQIGYFFACYIGSLNNCQFACIGTVSPSYRAELVCDDPYTGNLCDVVIQRQ